MMRWATAAFLAVFVLFLIDTSYDCSDDTPVACPTHG